MLKRLLFDAALLRLCMRTLNKFHGHTGDSYWGHDWCRLTRVNKLRALLTLRAAVKGKLTRDAAWFSANDCRVILNQNSKYSMTQARQAFDELLRECYRLQHKFHLPGWWRA